MEFKVCSSAFTEGDSLPAWYCSDDLNASPPLGWDGEPEETVSLAVVCRSSANRVHWVLWNIPNTTRTIYGKQPREGRLHEGIIQGVNDFGNTGWTGPSVREEGLFITVHLFALDCILDLVDPEADTKTLISSMKDHILKEASVTCAVSS